MSWRPGDDPSDFEPPETGEPLEAQLADLYAAGYPHLSAAAMRYEQARQMLGAITAHERFAFGSWFCRSRGQWQRLRSELETILTATRLRLADCGDNLCRIATEYAATDGVNGEEFRSIRDGYLDGIDPVLTPTLRDHEARTSYPLPTQGPY